MRPSIDDEQLQMRTRKELQSPAIGGSVFGVASGFRFLSSLTGHRAEIHAERH